ncbi:hypothetical protein [Pontibacter actiniarum]|uniref:Uncharacterized protein n=1 Tax=Pontibacter actiniarum TaxID=323450 RepID=A0A1X9YXS1_9BACT|nr:hypothetical protein [Pontibacter actiniarum]ARS37571.1 hypothetical protein CA264_20255 [Pontibacter actiniarum]
MNSEELEERLSDAERVLALHGKRLEKLEGREPLTPTQPTPALDYTAQLEEVKMFIKQHDLGVQALQIYAQISSFRETITKLPKVLPVRHYHHFEDRSRGFVIGGIVLLLTAAVFVGLCLSLYRENSRLRESDVKYRMIRQAYPGAGNWADSTFQQNPKDAKIWLEKREAVHLDPLLEQK